MKARTSKFSTKTSMAHNSLSLIRTHSIVHMPYYGTNDPPSPSNKKLFPTSVTPKSNATSHKKLPKKVPHIPNDPDSDTSSSDYSLPESSDSSDSRYSKQS